MTAEREEPGQEEPMADSGRGEEAGRAEPSGQVEPAGQAEPLAVGPGDPAAAAAVPEEGEETSLLSLVDRFAAVLERSDLGELEVTAGGTTIILRAPSAIERPVTMVASGPGAEAPAVAAVGSPGQAPATAPAAAPVAKPSVKAPLTGIFYGAPSPGATAYVAVGDHVSVGQIIGLIEAMKLFNEIKSDLAGRVVRICSDNGALVKARQPLIEVEPA